jgi:hypothetical protein
VVSVRKGVRRAVGRQNSTTVVTACDLLGTDGLDRADDEVAAGLLSDLYHPRLIITAEYIGPDRRAIDRREERRSRRESGRAQDRRERPGRRSDRRVETAGPTRRRWFR